MCVCVCRYYKIFEHIFGEETLDCFVELFDSESLIVGLRSSRSLVPRYCKNFLFLVRFLNRKYGN